MGHIFAEFKYRCCNCCRPKLTIFFLKELGFFLPKRQFTYIHMCRMARHQFMESNASSKTCHAMRIRGLFNLFIHQPDYLHGSRPKKRGFTVRIRPTLHLHGSRPKKQGRKPRHTYKRT